MQNVDTLWSDFSRPIANADDYIASLRGRSMTVYFMGERVPEPADHPVIEALLQIDDGNVQETHPLLALALFDDEKRTADVLARLEKIARGAADTLQACKSGSHQAHAGDLVDLVDAARRLTDQLVGQK